MLFVTPKEMKILCAYSKSGVEKTNKHCLSNVQKEIILRVQEKSIPLKESSKTIDVEDVTHFCSKLPIPLSFPSEVEADG